MKKQLLHISLGLLLLSPFSLFAEEVALFVPKINSKESSSTEEIASSTNAVSIRQTFTECSQQAIEDRDTKIASSRALYNGGMSKSLTERKNREKVSVAIKNEDDKKMAIKASIEAYKNQAKAAQNTLTQARKLAWSTFENDVEKCHELENLNLSTETPSGSPAPSLRKVEEKESKSIGNTIKAQFETLKSLFN